MIARFLQMGSNALLAMTALLLGLSGPAYAQETLDVQDVRVQYNFGKQINFQVRLPPLAGITQTSVLFRRSDEEITHVGSLLWGPDGEAHFAYDASLNVIPPFSTIVFWFQAAFADETTRTSPVFYFHYDDNRFAWQKASDGSLSLHWYDGDAAFGQAGLDSARRGADAIGGLLGLALDAPVDIYVYSTVEDLQGALLMGGKEWIAGHADPSLGVAMVAVSPGEVQAIRLDTEIPHELSHVLLYRSIGKGYERLPAWLSEGIASLVEAYPKPEYASALAAAAKSDSLIHFLDLCAAFPPDSGRAFLAYAESQSFARYLRDTYGSTGLAGLIRAYSDGLDCELGAARAVGVPLSQLDTRWREAALGQHPTGVALRSLVPYLLVMGLALAVPAWGVARMAAEKRKHARGLK